MKKESFILMVVFNEIQYDARVIRSAEALAELNIPVKVISCNSSETYKNDKFESLVYKSKKRGALLVLSFLIYVLKIFFRHRKEVKILYLHDYYTAGIGGIASLFSSVKWVYDAHELLFERKNNTYVKRNLFFLVIEKYSAKKADLVVAANSERERILRYVLKLGNTISVLNIAPRTEKKIIPFENRENVIVYQGYMTKNRNIDYFVNLLKFLPKNYKLKLIGDGPNLEELKKQTKKLGFGDRVIFTGKIPYSRIMEESAASKLGVVSYSLEGLNNYYCSPNKLYEYAQLGIPMLFSEQPFLRAVVSKYNIGKVFSMDDPQEKTAALISHVIGSGKDYMEGMEQFLSDYNSTNEMSKLKEAVMRLLRK